MREKDVRARFERQPSRIAPMGVAKEEDGNKDVPEALSETPAMLHGLVERRAAVEQEELAWRRVVEVWREDLRRELKARGQQQACDLLDQVGSGGTKEYLGSG